ncbi:glucose-6-phosphate isomerase [Sporanaerobacter acetigenes]|uniref:Glucose-6-phosphate isomerase n=1 Tax=Sporanaerobacter acetigenes DSM 13106 TaxID=1123281 RepID=A0A1M5Y588_9FIRM|nr:glucose-6-phosphate isomerase [Sporanaerobacter acetigenes]SHI07156.1 glucose-6-phosphate isomerase [Sporanaerobacter acetigenes DSM 13106]
MRSISLDYTHSFIEDYELENIKEYINIAHNMLHNEKGPGSEYTGWVNYPKEFDIDEYERVKLASEKIRKNSEVFIVIGIGGSYLGARACIEALNHNFYNMLTSEKRNGPEIYFVGNNVSSSYILELLELIDGKDISINTISKSGTTTEPAIAFRIFKEYIEEKYGKEEAKNRIYITTDSKKGALKELASKEGYETFTVPDDIGGRYSILTSVGLLPIAVSGLNIDEIMNGAKDGMEEYGVLDLDKNYSYQYAAIRNVLYRKGKEIEMLTSYEPSLFYLQEWWKQLFGESEGKDLKGIYPSSASFTTDLHSLGQLIQDGRRNIFETVINIEEPKVDMILKEDKENLDGLNFLSGKTIDFVNKKAFEGTLMAHTSGGVPNIILNIEKMNEYNFGKLIYFFEKSCAISGYLLGVNPFNQPGVEEYKKNMFRLLGKPGY